MTTLSLVETCRELRRVHGDRAPSYNQVWRLAAEGRIPCERKGRGYEIEPADIVRIETALNLLRPAPRRICV